MSAKESAVLETLYPIKKGDDVDARYEFGEGTCNDEHKGECSFRDAFTP